MKEDWHNYVKVLGDPSSNPKVLHNPNIDTITEPSNKNQLKTFNAIIAILALAPILFFLFLVFSTLLTPSERFMGIGMLLAIALIAFCIVYTLFSIFYVFFNIHIIRKKHLLLPTKTRVLIRIALFFAFGIAVYYPVYCVVCSCVPPTFDRTTPSFLISAILSIAITLSTTLNLPKSK